MGKRLRIRVSLCEENSDGRFDRECELHIQRLEDWANITLSRNPEVLAEYVAKELAHHLAYEFTRR
jgi:hypothetical protein